MLHRPCCTLHGYDVRWCVPARADFVHSDLAGRRRADHRNIQPCAPKTNSAKLKPKCVLSGAALACHEPLVSSTGGCRRAQPCTPMVPTLMAHGPAVPDAAASSLSRCMCRRRRSAQPRPSGGGGGSAPDGSTDGWLAAPALAISPRTFTTPTRKLRRSWPHPGADVAGVSPAREPAPDMARRQGRCKRADEFGAGARLGEAGGTLRYSAVLCGTLRYSATVLMRASARSAVISTILPCVPETRM